MKKPAGKIRPAKKPRPPLPQEGGSFIRQKDGRLVREGDTAAEAAAAVRRSPGTQPEASARPAVSEKKEK